jgi:DNA-binding GntR family transcriptional regulator
LSSPDTPRRPKNGQLLSQRVFDELESAIVRRELPPGTHLVEDEIAVKLGVSRTPVREAFRMLARAQWLELQPHVGARVRHPSIQEVRDLFQMREILDRGATEITATRATPEDVAGLREILRQGWEAVEAADSELLADLNFTFHGEIARMAGNELLLTILQEIVKQVRWHFTAVVIPRRADSWREHGAMVDAIEAHEAETAGRLIVDHNRRTLEAYVSAVVAGQA